MCDARYRFTAVDIGAPGRQSDSTIFKESAMGRKFINNEMNIPRSSKVEPNGPVLPYFTVADEGFPLSKFIMRPYPGRSTGKINFFSFFLFCNVECLYKETLEIIISKTVCSTYFFQLKNLMFYFSIYG
jgi:hypothetical protein